MKKIISLILILTMSSISFVACSNPEKGNVTADTTSAESSDKTVKDDLPERNFAGYTFRAVSQSQSNRQLDMYAEQDSKEDISAYVYKRNEIVKQRFNIDISVYWDDYKKINDLVIKSVGSGSDDFDIVFQQSMLSSVLLANDSYYPLSDLSYINLEKEYWDKNILSTYSINGTVYLANGDISPSTFMRTSLLAFNKNLLTQNNIEYPYQLVNDGKWTLDALSSLTKTATRDLNGDQTITATDDQFGLTSWYLDSAHSFYYGAGGMLVKRDSNDVPYLDLNVDTNTAILEKINEVINGNRSNFVTDISISSSPHQIFTQGRSYFVEASMVHLSSGTYRDMEQDFGIVPMPKFDENQKDYISFVSGAISMVGVPKTITDPEKIGIIIEALASTAYREITPNIYDIVCKARNIRDEDSSKMFDIVIRNRVFDLGYVDSVLYTSVGKLPQSILASNSLNVASYFASNQSTAENRISEILKTYKYNQ